MWDGVTDRFWIGEEEAAIEERENVEGKEDVKDDTLGREVDNVPNDVEVDMDDEVEDCPVSLPPSSEVYTT